MADKEYISIKKAVQLTGQPEHILLNLWKKYEPTSKVKVKKGKKYISLALLKKKIAPYPIESENIRTENNEQEPQNPPTVDTSPAFVELLTLQIQEKDKQLNARDVQIAQLIERTREQNNIIFSLEKRQQQLESRHALQIPVVNSADQIEKPQINYLFMALILLLIGVVLIIFYTFLNS